MVTRAQVNTAALNLRNQLDGLINTYIDANNVEAAKARQVVAIVNDFENKVAVLLQDAMDQVQALGAA